jgi:tripartite-type tricarboxylate transporter receptor subunit TctC
MIQQPSGFFVKADGSWKSCADIAKAAEQKSFKVAVTGFGSPDDMSVSYFTRRGMKLESIPFPEPGLRYASVVGGQSDMLYEQAGDVRSFLDGKQIRPVLFFSAEPFTPYRDVPYSKKLGYDVTLPQFRVFVAKAGTDPARVKLIADELAKVAREPDYAAYLKQQLAAEKSYVPAAGSAVYMAKWLDEAKSLLAATQNK